LLLVYLLLVYLLLVYLLLVYLSTCFRAYLKIISNSISSRKGI
jgi:hypothetical protein